MSSKASIVHELFSHIATRYDLANSILSGGLHFLWNRKLVHFLQPEAFHDYLDLCAGTGAIAKRYLKTYRLTGQVVLLDFCEPMLAIARKNLSPLSPAIEFIQGDAQNVPYADASFDRISLAYGLRNLSDPFQGLQESYRLLKAHGRLGILELTRPRHPFLKGFHYRWIKWIAGPISGALSQNPEAYAYLQESIQNFSEPHHIVQQMKAVGFKNVVAIPLNGQIATLFIGDKT